MNIAFPPYEPDKGLHDLAATNYVNNVKPVAGGYAPLKSLVTFTQPLATTPQNTFSTKTAGGVSITIAGSGTALYRLLSTGAWEDVSSGTYAVPPFAEWSFALFGTRIIATNIVDGAFYYDIGLSTDFAPLPNAPKAKYVAVVTDFVWLLGLESDDAGYAFSGLNNSEQWTPGENFSDSGTFPDGGEIMGCVPTVGGCYVVQKRMIRLVSFDPGSGFTFTATIANENIGAIAPLSIASIGQGDFVFLAQDGFYRGAAAGPIGAEKVNRTFLESLTGTSLSSVKAVVDPDEKLVYFRILSITGSHVSLIYDYQLDRWSQATEFLMVAGTVSVTTPTLEDLDVIYPIGIDSSKLTVDSTKFQGNKPALAGFSTDGKLGFYSGANLEAEVQTATIGLNLPMRSFVNAAYLIGDVGISGSGSFDDTDLPIDEITGSVDDYANPAFYLSLGGADYHQQSLAWGAEETPHSHTGIVPFRSSARLHRAKVKILSGVSWTHLTGVFLNNIVEGNR